MYGRKGSALVKELTYIEPGQLSAFNNDLFTQVIEECTGHLQQFFPLIRKIEELKKIEEAKKLNNEELEESDRKALNAHNYGALIHHLSLLCNKRCLITYVNSPAEIIRQLGWTNERVLPEKLKRSLVALRKSFLRIMVQLYNLTCQKLILTWLW